MKSDYIIITESSELNDETVLSDIKAMEEDEGASLRTLESQGISIIREIENPVSDKPRDQFTRELMDEGGIEIIPSDEDASYL